MFEPTTTAAEVIIIRAPFYDLYTKCDHMHTPIMIITIIITGSQ